MVQKWLFFQLIFQAIQARKMSFTLFYNEKTHLQAKKSKKFEKSKIDIFLKELTQGFGPKMAIFPTFLFQPIQARKMSFTIFQNEKKPFQAIKTRSSKSRKFDIFPKGLTHRFGPKMAIFPTFFLGNIDQENVFYFIVERKNGLLGYKNKQFKESKNCHFSKGVSPWFWCKIGDYSIFIFSGNLAQENVFYDILKGKNAFLGYKKNKFKKSKN